MLEKKPIVSKNQTKDNIPRIFIGPENICGIGRYLADWQRKEKNAISDFIVFKDNTSNQNSHRNFHLEKKNLFQQILIKIKFFFSALKNYDVFHFYFGKSLLPFSLDLPLLKLFGKKIIMDYVGSDIRLNRLENERNPYYHLIEQKRAWGNLDFFKRIRMFWQGLWFNYCLAERLLFSNALTSIPKVKIINDLWVVNSMKVPTKLPILKSKKKPMIVHALSNLLKKGTHYIQKAVDSLHEEGLSFDFRIFHKVPHEEFIRYMIDEADIVVDQLLVGDFGVLAMEAMTFAKPVCGFVLDELREMIPDLPIVQCTVDTIKDQLRDLILNPKKREQFGRKGWNFAKKHYDRDTTYEKLWQIYLELWNK